MGKHGVTKVPSLVQVTLGGLKAGTEYHVTLRVVLKNDTDGPANTFFVSTTKSKLV